MGSPLSRHLKNLEAESIAIFRETAASFARPVMLYSVGKDSSVLVRLALKAFYPGPIPFPLMHIDTGFKFPEMYSFRDSFTASLGVRLIVERNEEKIAEGMNPRDAGCDRCCRYLKTGALLAALEKHQFAATFGGARREEEKSRAKERVFSFRDRFGQWDPRNQRPELWNLFNGKLNTGESVRCFPLSNWTELDIWQYIRLENIPIVPLYFAKERPVVDRDGTWIMIDDERFPLKPGEVPQMKKVRFRTLGCYPLTGAVESDADTVEKIVEEMMTTRESERSTRVIDHDGDSSMEQKKREGYF